MLRSTPSRRRGAVLTLASAALAGVAAGAPPALAGSYEQVTRASGAQGWSPLDYRLEQVAVSDSGRYALFTAGVYIPLEAPTLYVRDIRSNTTRAVAKHAWRVFGVNRDETKVLFLRRTSADGDQELIVQPITGGAGRVLATFSSMATVDAALSGDGNTVAIHEFSYETGEAVSSTRLLNLRTGNATAVPAGERSLRLSERSLSDDGKVLAGSVDLDEGFYFAGGKFVDTPEETFVSPNGAIVAYTPRDPETGGASALHAIRVADGRQRTYPYPAGVAGNVALAWISPDGSRLAINADRDAGSPARVVNTATGGWTAFGGPYARSLTAPLSNSLQTPESSISRSGRFGLVAIGAGGGVGQSALIDLAGRDLVGAQESLSASVYVRASPIVAFCGSPSQTFISFAKADVDWLPVPQRARLEALVDGVRVADVTYEEYDGENGASTFTYVPLPAGVKKVVYRATVVDGFGKTLKETQTVDVQCLGNNAEPEPEALD